MINLFRVTVAEEFIIPAAWEGSLSTDTVTIIIRRDSDDLYYNFTTDEWQTASVSGSMTYDFGINWIKAFTPPIEDTYTVAIENSTLVKKDSIRLMAQGTVTGDVNDTSGKLAIVNSALRTLGALSISSITDDDDENARRMNAVYDPCLKALLRSHPWSFNKKEITLSQITTEPVLDDYLYIYNLPSDFIRLNKTSVEPDYSHKIKGRKLYSNANSISIEYGYFCTDANQFDAAFAEALSAKLAAELAYSITRDKDMVKLKWDEFKTKFNYAKSINGQEVTPDSPQEDQWLNSRQ